MRSSAGRGSQVYVFNAGSWSATRTRCASTAEGRRFVPVETIARSTPWRGRPEHEASELLAQNHIPLHVYNYYGYWSGSYMPREQYVSGHLTGPGRPLHDHEKRMVLARLLRPWSSSRTWWSGPQYYKGRGSEDLAAAVERFRKAIVGEPSTPEELMALEGGAANSTTVVGRYPQRRRLRVQKRTRRPPAIGSTRCSSAA